MPTNYRKLWKRLADMNLKKTDLNNKVGLSSSTIAKLSQNKTVTTDVLDRICINLGCNIEDIVEIETDTIPSEPCPGKYTVVSLFSGCGGLDLGFKGDFSFLNKEYAANPFDIIWANDFNKAACETYRVNIDKRIVEGSIEDVFDTMPTTADVVIGGFPCQDISINGKMAGVDGKRSGLYVWMVKAVERIRPKVFVAENVKALLMKRHASSLERVINDFSALGSKVSYNIYNAADYGVPQTRERVIIIGVRNDIKVDFCPPLPTTEGHPITVKEAISDLEDKDEDVSFSHIWSAAKPSSGQGLRFLSANEPSTTMRSECHGNLQFHYSLPRRISMREAARIQSFPDNFTFEARLRETERMIGNAVAPVFAWHIANAVLRLLETECEINEH